MKTSKAIVGITSLMAAILLGGCSTQTSTPGNQSTSSATPETATVATTTETTAAKPSDSGTLGDYSVTIKSATLAKDYQGKDALVVTYSFTNNGNDVKTFATAIATEAYQDGVQLSPGICVDTKVMDAQDELKNVQKGASLDVKCMYVLSNKKSDVTVDAKRLISLSNDKLEKVFKIS